MVEEIIIENLVEISYNENRIFIDLTEQEGKLIKKKGEVINTGNLGYINPKKIAKYFSSKFDKVFGGSPNLEIRIDFEDSWYSRLAGEYCFIHGELTEPQKSDIILSGPILVSDIEQNKINSKYVVEDNSGRIIPITKERIESEIIKIEKKDITASHCFIKIERLSKLAGLDYSRKINQLKESTQRNVLKRYSSRGKLEGVLERLESSTEIGCSSLFDEMSGDLQVINEFLKYLPEITLPQDLKERTINFLNNYAEAYEGHIDEAEEEVKEANEEMKTFKKGQQKVRELAVWLRNKK